MTQTSLLVESSADFSPCRTWRYTLRRRWSDGPMMMVIGLNPSTADEIQDDPTIRRCVGYAKRWGYAGLLMGNIFAFRATDPSDLYAADDPEGPLNNMHLVQMAEEAKFMLAAWGSHGEWLGRGQRVRELLWEYDLHCLGHTKHGQPKHPLYLRADAEPIKLGAVSLG